MWQPERVLLSSERLVCSRPRLLKSEDRQRPEELVAHTSVCRLQGALASVTSEAGSAQKSDGGDSWVETRVGWTVSEAPGSPKQEAAAKAMWVSAAKPVPRKSGESTCPGHGLNGNGKCVFYPSGTRRDNSGHKR